MLSIRCLSVLSVMLVYCGQTVGRIKMKLGMQVGLGTGQIVLGGDPAAPPQRGTAPPQFSAHICCGQMDQDVTWYGARPRPRRLYVRWGPSPLSEKGQSPSPILRVEVENFEIGPEVGGTSGYS